jgi:hypothetical protein
MNIATDARRTALPLRALYQTAPGSDNVSPSVRTRWSDAAARWHWSVMAAIANAGAAVARVDPASGEAGKSVQSPSSKSIWRSSPADSLT